MEQRRPTRYEFFELAERYDVTGETLIEKGRVLNISDNGILYKGDVPLAIGERYKLRFEVGGDYFFVEGQVMRLSKHPLDRKPLAGIKLAFTDLQKEKLLSNLKRLNVKPVL